MSYYLNIGLVLLVFVVPCFAEEIDDADLYAEEPLEEAVTIEDDDELDVFETPFGEVRYRSSFLGKEYCVRMHPADPLDSFDYGSTVVFPCE